MKDDDLKIMSMGFEICDFGPDNSTCDKCEVAHKQLYYQGPRDAATYWCKDCIIKEYNIHYPTEFISKDSWKEDEKAILYYDDISIELPFTYLHHLTNIFPIIDSLYVEFDIKFKKLLENIVDRMWQKNR